MTEAPAAAHSAARILIALVILAATCAPAVARHRHPRLRAVGSFCVPVIAEGVGMVRICGVPTPPRR